MKKKKKVILLGTAILGGICWAIGYVKKAYSDGMSEIKESINEIDLR